MRSFAILGMLVATVSLVTPALSQLPDSWIAFSTTDLTGDCPASPLLFSLGVITGYMPGGDPVCTQIVAPLDLQFPRIRDIDTGCTIGDRTPLPPSQEAGGGNYLLCAADYHNVTVPYVFVGVASDNPALDCDQRPGPGVSGPNVDDDGDGRIDEEWPNGVDDDDDGLIDEDLRCEVALYRALIVAADTGTWGRLKARYH